MEYGYYIERISLQHKTELETLRTFLMRHHLRFEDDIQVAFGIFDSLDNLVGCGCAAGNLLKCFAVDDELRGQNALGSLVSVLIGERFESGVYNLFVVTRTKNEPLFRGCGFSTVVRTTELVLLENRSDGPERYAAQYKRTYEENKCIGAIVMNCNPFTLGHQWLVKYAANNCDILYIFVVEEDRSQFSSEIRIRLVREGVKDISNVFVCPSGDYILSKETFPTYFLKEDEDPVALQTELDITLFAERIAPLFHISKRFAGTEPLDPVTAKYNNAMRAILPRNNVEFCEVPRLSIGDNMISASKVRELLANPLTYEQAYLFVPKCTQDYLEQIRWINCGSISGRTKTDHKC